MSVKKDSSNKRLTLKKLTIAPLSSDALGKAGGGQRPNTEGPSACMRQCCETDQYYTDWC
jgi:hypothetical protein